MKRALIPVVLLVAGVLSMSLATPAAVAAIPGAFPTGTLTETGSVAPGQSGCPATGGWTCFSFKVESCPNVGASINGQMAVSPVPANHKGTVIAFRGGAGTSYWTNSPEGGGHLELINGLWQDHQLQVVQVKWVGKAWYRAASGEASGPARLGCRPATAIRYILNHPEKFPAAPAQDAGECGWCLLGNSGGTAQVAYPVTHFGLAPDLDGVFMVGGPTHTALAKGCIDTPKNDDYYFPQQTTFDESYGYAVMPPPDNQGPCLEGDASFVPTWNRDSIDTQGSDYSYPTTRIHHVIGGNDSLQIYHSGDYVDRLEFASPPSPFVTREIIPGMEHELDENGFPALEAAIILDTASGNIRACNNGVDDDLDGAADFPADAGCASATDTGERNLSGPLCDNGIDDDNDGDQDVSQDASCTSASDATEGVATVVACNNGVDDDGDGTLDSQADPGCSSPTDTSELGTAQCDNGIDDDADTKVDFRTNGTGDTGCSSLTDTTEAGAPPGRTISITDVSKNEGTAGCANGTTQFSFKATISSSSTSNVTVKFATANGTATAGPTSDYNARANTTTWTPGTSLTRSINILVRCDATVEPNETFVVNLTQPSAGTTIADPQALGTILNDDA